MAGNASVHEEVRWSRQKRARDADEAEEQANAAALSGQHGVHALLSCRSADAGVCDKGLTYSTNFRCLCYGSSPPGGCFVRFICAQSKPTAMSVCMCEDVFFIAAASFPLLPCFHCLIISKG